MISTILRIGLIGAIGVALTFLPWPDIDFVLYPIALGVSYAYTFNNVFPIDTTFSLGLIALGIEFAMFLYRLTMQVLGYINGNTVPSDKPQSGRPGDWGVGGP